MSRTELPGILSSVQPDVSVLMPIAPQAHWLRAALEGLRAQTLANWELVVVLDGDCPENRGAIDEARLPVPVTIALTAGGQGVAPSLNLGLEHCRADFVARHDADDVSAPDRLRLQAVAMEKEPDILVLGTGARLIDESGQVVGQRDVPTGTEVIRRLLWRNALIHPSVMMRRKTVASAGGYDVSSPRTEDYELWLRLAAQGRLDNLPEHLVDYRIHGQQHSRAGSLGGASRQIRLARRAAAQGRGGSRLGADLRHIAWASVQIARGRGL